MVSNTARRTAYLAQVDEWEYCYCRTCDKIRYSDELEVTERGIRCSQCGGYNLEAPGWIHCPHETEAAVKCPRAGRGINEGRYAEECQYRCSFRKA